MYKFLATGARGPMSGFQWPTDGSWVEVAGALETCVNGVHVCRGSDLPYWLHDELWEVELAGEQLDGVDCVVVRRARLTRRIESWQRDGAHSFVEAATQHAEVLVARADAALRERAQGYVEDARYCADARIVAFGALSAAIAVGQLAPPEEATDAYRQERAWQAEWLRRCVITGN